MEKIRTKPFKSYNPFGKEEVEAVNKVVKSGILSDFIGAIYDDKFFGGKYVQKFEKMWADYHQVKYAVSFNSATSALVASLGALEILPGDEILVVGYSMCISATAPLFYDAIPIFVDLEEDYYCMDPKKIKEKITSRTKAILPVDLFGQSSDMVEINKIAKKYNLKVLSDASHVPGSKYLDGYAGTFGDIGVYSLNQHKIIHCGEGGVAVTNDEELALRLQLIRNHAEAVIPGMHKKISLVNMLGGNYRMGEMEASIAIEQLKKLPKLLDQRISLANYLTDGFSKLEFITPPKVRETCNHVYYLYPIKFDEQIAGISRVKYIENINTLGIPLHKLAGGYIKPLYKEPIFAKQNEFKNGYPYNLVENKYRINYTKVSNPVIEKFYEKEFIVTAYHQPPNTKEDMDDIIKAFTKAVNIK